MVRVWREAARAVRMSETEEHSPTRSEPTEAEPLLEEESTLETTRLDDALEEVDTLKPVREGADANIGRTLQVVHVANLVPIFRKAKLCLAFIFMVISWVFAGGVLSIELDKDIAAGPPIAPPPPPFLPAPITPLPFPRPPDPVTSVAPAPPLISSPPFAIPGGFYGPDKIFDDDFCQMLGGKDKENFCSAKTGSEVIVNSLYQLSIDQASDVRYVLVLDTALPDTQFVCDQFTRMDQFTYNRMNVRLSGFKKFVAIFDTFLHGTDRYHSLPSQARDTWLPQSEPDECVVVLVWQQNRNPWYQQCRNPRTGLFYNRTELGYQSIPFPGSLPSSLNFKSANDESLSDGVAYKNFTGFRVNCSGKGDEVLVGRLWDKGDPSVHLQVNDPLLRNNLCSGNYCADPVCLAMNKWYTDFAVSASGIPLGVKGACASITNPLPLRFSRRMRLYASIDKSPPSPP